LVEFLEVSKKRGGQSHLNVTYTLRIIRYLTRLDGAVKFILSVRWSLFAITESHEMLIRELTFD